MAVQRVRVRVVTHSPGHYKNDANNLKPKFRLSTKLALAFVEREMLWENDSCGRRSRCFPARPFTPRGKSCPSLKTHLTCMIKRTFETAGGALATVGRHP